MIPLPVRVALCLAATVCSLGAQAPRPNVIFFFTDDLGYGDLGCFWQDGRSATKKFDAALAPAW